MTKLFFLSSFSDVGSSNASCNQKSASICWLASSFPSHLQSTASRRRPVASGGTAVAQRNLVGPGDAGGRRRTAAAHPTRWRRWRTTTGASASSGAAGSTRRAAAIAFDAAHSGSGWRTGATCKSVKKKGENG
jgi:hypothetical protein